MSARSLAIFSLLLLATIFLAKPTLAQQPTVISTSSSALQINQSSPQYSDLMVINLVHTFSCLAEGASIIGQPCLEYQLPNSKPISNVQPSKGALSAIAALTTGLYYTPPARVSEYIAYVGSSVIPVQSTYAQVSGSGNNVLSPVFEIWRVSRNVAYVFMIAIFLVIGFMIMFRQKLNPQTVISAQNALPGLAIGLILITFSYFLSALLIDATFVGTRLVAGVYESTVIQKGSMDKLFADGNILNLFNKFIEPKLPSEIIDSTINTVDSLKQTGAIGNIIENVSTLGGCLVAIQLAPKWEAQVGLLGTGIKIPIGDLVTKSFSCAAGGGLARLIYNVPGATGTLTGLILYVVLVIALLIAMFRVMFSLITCYITIIIYTILSPFQFLIAGIPGRQAIVTNWFKSMIANLLAFPAVFAALVFAAYILGLDTDLIKANTATHPIDFANGTLILMGGLSPSFLRIILAYGVLLMTPNIPETVRNMLGVKGGLGDMTKTAFGGFMAGVGVGRAGVGKLTEGMRQERQMARETALKEFYTKHPESAPWYVRILNPDYSSVPMKSHIADTIKEREERNQVERVKAGAPTVEHPVQD